MPSATRRSFVHGLGAALGLGLTAVPLAAQQSSSTETRPDATSVREVLDEIRRDLAEIKDSLPRRARDPINALVDVRRFPYQGERNAPLTLVEFSDYQCAFCAQHVRETAPVLTKEYVRTGKLKTVVVDFPLERAHPLAFKAAELAACAREQGRFWEMRERLFANASRLEPWEAHGKALGLDDALLDECLASGRNGLGVRQGMTDASRLNINGTPHFLIGRTEREGAAVRVAESFMGAKPIATFREQLDRLLAEGAASTKEPGR